MKYTYHLTSKSLKQLRKLDKSVQRLLFNWLDKHLQNTENPRLHGKPLSDNRSNEWSYRAYRQAGRVGDYRILAHIRDDIVEIKIIRVGHRRNVYDN